MAPVVSWNSSTSCRPRSEHMRWYFSRKRPHLLHTLSTLYLTWLPKSFLILHQNTESLSQPFLSVSATTSSRFVGMLVSPIATHVQSFVRNFRSVKASAPQSQSNLTERFLNLVASRIAHALPQVAWMKFTVRTLKKKS